MAQTTPKNFVLKWYPLILAVMSVIGFTAAFVLTLEHQAVLANPSHKPSCSINPVLTCGPIMSSAQGRVFSFPNPFLGLFGFGVLLAVAVNMMAGATVDKAKRWYWGLFTAAHVFGLGFVVWLIAESIYTVRALCIYCMVTWVVVIALNWYGWLWLTETKRLPASKAVLKFHAWGMKNHLGVVLLAYAAIFGMILFQFDDYFRTIF